MASLPTELWFDILDLIVPYTLCYGYNNPQARYQEDQDICHEHHDALSSLRLVCKDFKFLVDSHPRLSLLFKRLRLFRSMVTNDYSFKTDHTTLQVHCVHKTSAGSFPGQLVRIVVHGSSLKFTKLFVCCDCVVEWLPEFVTQLALYLATHPEAQIGFELFFLDDCGAGHKWDFQGNTINEIKPLSTWIFRLWKLLKSRNPKIRFLRPQVCVECESIEYEDSGGFDDSFAVCKVCSATIHFHDRCRTKHSKFKMCLCFTDVYNCQHDVFMATCGAFICGDCLERMSEADRENWKSNYCPHQTGEAVSD